MRHFLITVIGTIVGLFLAVFLFLFFVIGIGFFLTPDAPDTKSMLLDIDLTQGLVDQSSGENLFGKDTPSVIDIVRKLDQAAGDPKVQGLFIRANPYVMSPAQAEEIRLALTDFASSEKFIIAHAQGFEGTSLSPYMAVSAASEIWLQDTAGFSASGYRAETPFYGGVFEKFDAKPEFEQFKEYKSAANAYTQTGYTDAHRESTTQMLQFLYDQGTALIAQDRQMTTDSVDALLRRAPLSAEQALEAGLVDTLGHYAAAREHTLELAGSGAEFKSITDYELTSGSGPLIAVISGQGTIMTGKSASATPFSSTTTMGSDTISKALTDAANNDSVKAIIVRVNSPGGSAIASDQMWDAVVRAKAAGKPVIVSMGQYAASGGYYLAAPADHILALPMTITGSIGVLGGKVALGETFDKVGYNVEAISVGGEYSAVFSATEPWSQRNRAAFRQSMEDIYLDFTSKVASGRDMSPADVESVAKGRVWTGGQALSNGLVDELGGFMAAIDAAKELADIAPDSRVRLRNFPREKSTTEQLQDLLGASASAAQTLEQLEALAASPDVQAVIAARERLTRSPETLSLMAPIPNLP